VTDIWHSSRLRCYARWIYLPSDMAQWSRQPTCSRVVR